jgi:GMP synthase-like glutamine amidotransferase
MKPIAIFQHDITQGPGFLLEFLDKHTLPWECIRPTLGDSIPTLARDFSGLVFLGSPHSVNDSFDWIETEGRLMASALANDVPVLGHCFGGQLLAKVLGARVYRNPCPQIGWAPVHLTTPAQRRFGIGERFTSFHWHYESFTTPRGATRLFYGEHSLNKGFAFGHHLGLQCHLEVTEAIIRAWCAEGAEELRRHRDVCVQTSAGILQNLPLRLEVLHRVARRIYSQWLGQVLHQPIPPLGWSPRSVLLPPRSGQALRSL